MESFESQFPKDYRKDDIESILKYVLTGKFSQLISLPGGGKATILKLLSSNQNLRKFHLGDKESTYLFVYLNLLELPDYEQATIEKFLLLRLNPTTQLPNDPLALSQKLKDTINELANHKQKTLVLLFDHFDEFQNHLTRNFFQTLRSLRSLVKYRFSSVFATRRDLRELIDPEIRKEFYDFFVENAVFMKLYDKTALDFMFAQIEMVLGKTLTEENKKKIIDLTSGHTKLTKVSSETVLQDDITPDATLLERKLVRATLFELWLFLTSEEQQILINIVLHQTVEQNDALKNLENFGLLEENSKFTIPLFEEFVKKVAKELPKEKLTYDAATKEVKKGTTIISDLLSLQEYRLLTFFIQNEGKIIEREEIVNAVWPEVKTQVGISEAAIDQMIFRLRKKIEEEPNNPQHVVTVKGRGFRFVP